MSEQIQIGSFTANSAAKQANGGFASRSFGFGIGSELRSPTEERIESVIGRESLDRNVFPFERIEQTAQRGKLPYLKMLLIGRDDSVENFFERNGAAFTRGRRDEMTDLFFGLGSRGIY